MSYPRSSYTRPSMLEQLSTRAASFTNADDKSDLVGFVHTTVEHTAFSDIVSQAAIGGLQIQVLLPDNKKERCAAIKGRWVEARQILNMLAEAQSQSLELIQKASDGPGKEYAQRKHKLFLNRAVLAGFLAISTFYYVTVFEEAEDPVVIDTRIYLIVLECTWYTIAQPGGIHLAMDSLEQGLTTPITVSHRLIDAIVSALDSDMQTFTKVDDNHAELMSAKLKLDLFNAAETKNSTLGRVTKQAYDATVTLRTTG